MRQPLPAPIALLLILNDTVCSAETYSKALIANEILKKKMPSYRRLIADKLSYICDIKSFIMASCERRIEFEIYILV